MKRESMDQGANCGQIKVTPARCWIPMATASKAKRRKASPGWQKCLSGPAKQSWQAAQSGFLKTPPALP